MPFLIDLSAGNLTVYVDLLPHIFVAIRIKIFINFRR